MCLPPTPDGSAPVLRRSLAFLYILAAGCAAMAATTPLITQETLLQEMVDREALARLPVPPYQQRQASTYNRASVARDQLDQSTGGWFADSDGVFCLRQETNPRTGKVEYVLMDHTGPGAITKLWTPFFYYDYNNRRGPQIRIYLDGSPEPALAENLIEWVTRLEWQEKAYGSKPSSQNHMAVPGALAGFTARAGNSYLPIPFARSCKVTLDDRPFYDIISYRSYPEGTAVETFSPAAYVSAARQDSVRASGDRLRRTQDETIGQRASSRRQLGPREALTLKLPRGAAAIRHLEIQLDPQEIRAHPEILRSTALVVSTDGEPAVWCPVGDFFGSANGLHALQTWTRSVDVARATLVCSWVMPYQKKASVTLTNLSAQRVTARLTAHTRPWRWDERSMYFHANWRPDHIQVGAQFTDWNFVEVRGQGVLVGDAWTVLNRTRGWWGEGDEKIYVDDEYDVKKFPGLFGTGTEDYYGWAGGVNPTRADEFTSPFLANVQVGSTDFDGSLGFNICTRIRSLDAVPFRQRLVFDMEASPGVDQRNPWDLLMYSSVTFWYGRPGAVANRGPDPAAAARAITSLEELNRQSDQLRVGNR